MLGRATYAQRTGQALAAAWGPTCLPRWSSLRPGAMRLSQPTFRHQSSTAAVQEKADTTGAGVQKEERLKMFESAMKRRFFFVPAFSIYEGRNAAGLFDLGPHAVGLKQSILREWRRLFVTEADRQRVYEFEGSSVVPEVVLRASGHYEKFHDVLVKDKTTDECHRFDHLLLGHLQEQVAAGAVEEATLLEAKRDISLGEDCPTHCAELQKKYNLTTHPDSGNELSQPFAFNLMFETAVGAEGKGRAFLRPETAQGIFANFQRFYDMAGSRLPFAVTCIGSAFRNEANPRQGLLRTREFAMAELEYFHWADETTYPAYEAMKETQVPVMGYESLTGGGGGDTEAVTWVALEEARDKGVVSTDLAAVFMAKAVRFMGDVGVQDDRIRLRKHKSTEMAHYATECWDVELLTDRYGWVECAGISDRACYDLEQHSRESKTALSAFRPFPDGPKTEMQLQAKPQHPAFGKHFRKAGKAVQRHLADLTCEEVREMQEAKEAGRSSVTLAVPELAADGKAEKAEAGVSLPLELVDVKEVPVKVTGKTEHPHVLEPSFGIGRILYAVLEQSFYLRPEDKERGVLGLPSHMAPVKCVLLPLSNDARLKEAVWHLSDHLSARGVSHTVDDSSSSIGRRYARADEVGIPFAVTVDFDTVGGEDTTEYRDVTVRLRDSMEQEKCSFADVAEKISQQSQRGALDV